MLREQLQKLLAARLAQQQQRMQLETSQMMRQSPLAAEPPLAMRPVTGLTKRQRLDAYLSSFVVPTPDSSPTKQSAPADHCTLASAQDRYYCAGPPLVGACSPRESVSIAPPPAPVLDVADINTLVRRSSSSLLASEGSLTDAANMAMGLPQWRRSPTSGDPSSSAPSCNVDVRWQGNHTPPFAGLLEQLRMQQQQQSMQQTQHVPRGDERGLLSQQNQQSLGAYNSNSHGVVAFVARQSPVVVESQQLLRSHIEAVVHSKVQSAVDEASASRRTIAALEAKVAILSNELVQSQRKLAASRSQSAALEASLARSQLALVQATIREGYGDSDEASNGSGPDQPCCSSCH
ncbi:hypothetical protein CLOM_g15625 [Closterium sp. NIES-68]|nr:hypothetical protein CLOM_g15625 [Closterium sp. NIES-68]GJP65074.1 hypothetical protein CLOP_g21983 [Closterium sp. NIES-67]